MIKDLPTVLCWLDTTDAPFDLYTIHLYHLSSALGYTLGHILQRDPIRGEMFLTKLRNLPDSAFLRFLTAPETFFRLSYSAEGKLEDIISFLSNSIEAEYCRLERCTNLPHEVWTALGDCFFPAQQNMSQNSQAAIFHAPRLSNRIPVDFKSPWAQRRFADISSSAADFTTDEVYLVLRKLDEAILEISKVNMYLLDTLTCFTRVIIVRKDVSCLDSFMSSSSHMYSGRTILVNPQLEKIDVAKIADALIHEMIHSLLYALELKYPFILDTTAVADVHIRSPWTGNELTVSSYLHACFVWFGLWNFWKLAINSRGLPKERIYTLIAISSAGFKKGSLLDALEEISFALSPDVQQNIQRVQEIVSSSD